MCVCVCVCVWGGGGSCGGKIHDVLYALIKTGSIWTHYQFETHSQPMNLIYQWNLQTAAIEIKQLNID